ncbi:unnamed protein product [Pedinophyceae sp. YPF-701]|nr:unnamed protein product [Pedinophyceae sp. YPF-701]
MGGDASGVQAAGATEALGIEHVPAQMLAEVLARLRDPHDVAALARCSPATATAVLHALEVSKAPVRVTPDALVPLSAASERSLIESEGNDAAAQRWSSQRSTGALAVWGSGCPPEAAFGRTLSALVCEHITSLTPTVALSPVDWALTACALPSLATLDLGDVRTSSASLCALVSAFGRRERDGAPVRHLTLRCDGLDQRPCALDVLAGLRSLRRLVLSRTGALPTECFDAIGSLDALEDLAIYSGCASAVVLPLATCAHNAGWGTPPPVRITERTLQTFAKLPALRSLAVDALASMPSAASLAPLSPTLQTLVLRNCASCADAASDGAALASLSGLYGARPEGWGALALPANLHSLTRLVVERGNLVAPHSLHAMLALPALEELVAGEIQVQACAAACGGEAAWDPPEELRPSGTLRRVELTLSLTPPGTRPRGAVADESLSPLGGVFRALGGCVALTDIELQLQMRQPTEWDNWAAAARRRSLADAPPRRRSSAASTVARSEVPLVVRGAHALSARAMRSLKISGPGGAGRLILDKEGMFEIAEAMPGLCALALRGCDHDADALGVLSDLTQLTQLALDVGTADPDAPVEDDCVTEDGVRDMVLDDGQSPGGSDRSQGRAAQALRLPRGLRALSIVGNHVRDADVANIVECRRLRSLHLQSCQGISDQGFGAVLALPHLRSLSITDSRITAAVFQQGLPAQLQHLDLSSNRALCSASAAAHIAASQPAADRRLLSINLSWTGAARTPSADPPPDTVASLATVPSLQRLWLKGCSDVRGIEALTRLQRLELLAVCGCPGVCRRAAETLREECKRLRALCTHGAAAGGAGSRRGSSTIVPGASAWQEPGQQQRRRSVGTWAARALRKAVGSFSGSRASIS